MRIVDLFKQIQWKRWPFFLDFRPGCLFSVSLLVAGVLATGVARIYRRKAVLYNSDSGFYPSTTLEVLFGVLFIFMMEGRIPSHQEWAVIAILVWGMALFYRNRPVSQACSASSG